ncbi:glucosaminidase domain-containing protein [Mucilaginibacter sp. HMF5004]|uniref:glucosaminidase domain-containing protein n=1 Tax=Mucilaginibacter rivuli TaxID=2857527 RepID=UPI001C608003|nr:glucosaminidase domain-containing protein [Mucilaginibacter rivuli]MBW4890401.1 glucosaminidase domain-containing protein [Mucilaginibacter rivuli]
MKKILLVAFLLISVGASAQTKSQSYIEKFKDDAVRIMHQTGVPASIILAIAMHESASGCSAIAQNLNNQFGMKGYGTTTYKKRKKTITSSYRKYDSPTDSFNDFARIMTEKPKFIGLSDQFTHYDYLGWAHGIQKAGYASSRKWASQVLGMIKKYNLNMFDENPDDKSTILASADSK